MVTSAPQTGCKQVNDRLKGSYCDFQHVKRMSHMKHKNTVCYLCSRKKKKTRLYSSLLENWHLGLNDILQGLKGFLIKFWWFESIHFFVYLRSIHVMRMYNALSWTVLELMIRWWFFPSVVEVQYRVFMLFVLTANALLIHNLPPSETASVCRWGENYSG